MRVMRGHARRAERCRVDGGFVELAGEIGTRRAPIRIVTTYPPVARVRASSGLGIGSGEGAVHVQFHSVGALSSHDVVPKSVVVAFQRCHGAQCAEDEPSVVAHVDVPVIGRAVAGLLTAEADQFAARGSGRLEPDLLRVCLRVVDRCVGRDGTALPVERDSSAARPGQRTGSAEDDTTRVGAWSRVEGGVTGLETSSLVESPIKLRGVAVDERAVRVAWRGAHATTVDVVTQDDISGQSRGIEGYVVDGAVEVHARRLARP